MGLHLVLLAKFKILSLPSSTHTVISPFLNSLLCPYLLKLACSHRLVRQTYSDLIYASRFFLFRLSRIAFDENHNSDEHHQFADLSNRWERALRLILQRARRSSTVSLSEEDSFHALSIFAL